MRGSNWKQVSTVERGTVGRISIIAALLSAQITALPPIDSSFTGKEVESEDESERGSEHSLEERRAREIEMVEDCQFIIFFISRISEKLF